MNAYEKLREALLALDAWVKVVKNNPKDTTAIECAEFVEETIKAALAEPRRNCDVGTAEERVKRYHEFCRGRVCETCPAMTAEKDDLEDGSCIIQWEDMPYEEGGAKCPEAINR